MKRALAALTVAAYLTLVIDVVGEHSSALSLLPGTAFLLAATLGFAWTQRQAARWVGYVHIAILLSLGTAVFALSYASVGATLLLVVLVSQTVLLLPLPAVAVLVALLPLLHAGMSLAEGLREGLGLLAAALFAAVVTKLLMREQEGRAALARAHEQLREHTAQAERLAAEQERNRMARDIHDGLGHSLTVVQMQIKAARAVLAAQPGRADEVLAKAQDQAEEALREVRRSVGLLRAIRPAMSLPQALRALVEQASAAGVPTQVDVTGQARPLPDEVRESLFRAAQEGLTNVRKHACASRAELVLDYSQPAAVLLEVRDDGAGTAGGATVSTGFGLVGVQERAVRLGGWMTLAPAASRGSVLRVEVPG